MKHFQLFITIAVLAFISSSAFGKDHYKIQLDPTLSLLNYANIQVDRSVTDSVSIGAMYWYFHDRNGEETTETESSVGARVDWFDRGVFERGWHSNGMVKVDFEEGVYARTRLKLTQTYQLAFSSFYINLGIGAQFVDESEDIDDSLYSTYRSWLMPAWEFSLGRSF